MRQLTRLPPWMPYKLYAYTHLHFAKGSNRMVFLTGCFSAAAPRRRARVSGLCCAPNQICDNYTPLPRWASKIVTATHVYHLGSSLFHKCATGMRHLRKYDKYTRLHPWIQYTPYSLRLLYNWRGARVPGPCYASPLDLRQLYTITT